MCWLVRRQAGLGNIFRPWTGHIYSRNATKIDKDERNFDCWASNRAPKGIRMLRKKKALPQILLCVDWQRYSKRFHEDIRNIKIRFEFFFQMSETGERDNWKEPSKYLETWEVTWKDNMPSRAEGFFSKADHLKRKNQERTNWQRAKEQRFFLFIHRLICQLSLGSVNLLAAASRFLIQFWSEIAESSRLPSQRQYTISSQHCRTKSPTDHIVFTGHTKSQWHSLEHHHGHSLSVKREVLVTSNGATSSVV